ncbi:MAG TPA: type VI secretion system Vgr family protein [Burkholderiaceae bacterium]|jgi:type VI secretion system VgrG family protein
MLEAIQSISSLISQLVSFSSDTRLYDIDTPLSSDKLIVENFVAKEEVSGLYQFQINCLSTDTHIELKSLLGQQIAFKTKLADGTYNTRTGWVSQAAQLGSDGGLARYRLTMVPWLWLATQRRTSRVFQEKSVLQIIEEVLSGDAPRNNWRITSDVENFLSKIRIRSYCCQYRETDYAFLTRILAEEGIGFYFEEDDSGGSLSKQRLVLFADSTQFTEDYSSSHANGGKGIRFHRNAAVEVQDTIQQMGAERISQAELTTISGWDYQSKSVISASLPTVHPTVNKEAPQIESCDWLGIYPFSTQDEAEHYVRILREAADCRTKTWFGQSTVRTFRPGTVFELTQSAFDPIALLGQTSSAPKEHRFALMGVLHAGVNNLPSGLKNNLQTRLGTSPTHEADQSGPSWRNDGLHAPQCVRGFDLRHGTQTATAHPLNQTIASAHLSETSWDELLEQAETTGYANRFTSIRSDIPWRPALQDGTGALLNPKPTALGPQTAIVVGPDGSTADAGTVHTDALGRIRIRYHWQQGESNTCWVRVAQLFAGPGYGAQFIPRIGQEVLVKFFGNDIDRPIVNGVLYNGQGQDDSSAFAAAKDHGPAGQDNKIGNGASPAWHGAAAGEHGHAGYLSGFKSVAHGADGLANQSNQLVFDDTTGRLRTQLATDSAGTQLNLGHMIHQADNYRGSFRGTGWEMRTDAYGAIRAGKGLLITTYYGTAPDGKPEPAGENTAGIALLKQAQGFADTFNGAATTHQTVQMIAAKGDKTLNQGKSESALDDKLPPLAAMLKKVSGQVSAQDGSEDGGDKKIPHSTAPIITVAAQAGLGMTASDGLHYAAGEAAHFASGRDTNVAVGEAMTMHSGQAIGILAGAVSAGEGDTGIKLYAGQGDVDLQAQSDTMTFASKDLLKMISANSHLDFAAAKSITLCVEGGASLTIDGGNITFACPGLLSIKSSSKSFTGPTSQSYALPVMPASQLGEAKFELSLQDIPGMHGAVPAGIEWKIVLVDSEIHPLTDTGAINPAIFGKDHWERVICQGIVPGSGKIDLTKNQQQELFAQVSRQPKRIWCIYGLTAIPLTVAHWTTDTQQPNPHRVMDALNFTPNGQGVNQTYHEFIQELARKDGEVSEVNQLKKNIDF